MIEVRELTRRYGALLAVDRLSFTAREGEVLGLLGPNAAGKTTTMRVVTGYLSPTAGEVTVGGIDLFRAPLDARGKIGYLPEKPPLYPEMTVAAYLGFAADIRNVPRGERRRRVGEAMERTGVAAVASRVIATLSKGYRQRVGIAQALVHNPPVLVLDEPTVGLDPRQILEVRSLVRGLAGDHTVLFSSHILPEVAAVCGRVVILRRGRLVAIDTPGNLTRRLLGGERIVAEVSGGDAASLLPALRKVEGVVAAAHEPGEGGASRLLVDCDAARLSGPSIARIVHGAGLSLHALTPVELSLEEIFLSLTDERQEGAGAA